MNNANENENPNKNKNQNQNKIQNQNGNEDADKIINEKMDRAVAMREPSSFTLQRDQIKTEQVWPIISGHGSNNNNVNLKFFLFTASRVKIFRQLTRQEARR